MEEQKLSTDVAKAALDTSEVLRFEHWLRFYYLKERGGALVYDVPQAVVEKVRADAPHLAGLMEMVNGAETDQQRATENVCAFMASRMDGQKYQEGVLAKVFDSPSFKIEMYLFGLWNQSHEGLLDQEERDFAQWEKLYAEWRQDEKVKAYVAKLVSSQGQAGSTATQ